MRIAHLSDLHLGFRQYHRQTRAGINQREADVAIAFRRAIDSVMEAAPDVILVAGDVFHSVRPTNPAILDAFNQFGRLASRSGVPVVMVAGNHDTPRSVETGSILRLFEAFDGLTAVTTEARRIEIPDLGLELLAVPHAAVVAPERPVFRPETDLDFHVLLAHGEVAGVVPGDRTWRAEAGALVDPRELAMPQWDYVALGHYHVPHKVADNAWYSGSLEYVTSNPWGELSGERDAGSFVGKGWLLVELQPGKPPSVEFRRIQLERRVIDLDPVHAAGMGAEEVDTELAKRVGAVKGGIEDAVVRQVVYDIPRGVSRDLDHARIREYRSRTLHYQLDLRRPELNREVGIGAPARGKSLSEIVIEYLEKRPLSPDVDRTRLVELGKRHIQSVLPEDES